MAEKLIRDKIPDIVLAKGETLTTRTASEEEMRDVFLPKKVVEEAQEYQAATTQEEIIEEAADLLTALYASLHAHGVSMIKVLQQQDKKDMERGGFGKRVILSTEGE